MKNNQLKLKEMEISLNYLNVIINYILGDPDSIKNPSVMRRLLGINNPSLRFHETLAIYLYQNYGDEGIINLTNEQKEEAIRTSGIIAVPNSNNFISFKQGNILDEFSNVDATIIFRNSFRHLYLVMPENLTIKMYSTETYSWDDVHEFYENTVQNNIVYKLINRNKISYCIFIDTNYIQDNIDFNEFLNKKVYEGITMLREMIGKTNITELAMSFTYMNNFSDDQIALPIVIETVTQLLLDDNFIKNVVMIDFENSFNNFYRTNYKFILD